MISILKSSSRRAVWYGTVLTFAGVKSDSLVVPAMAWSSRPAWHSALPLRSRPTEQEEHLRVRKESCKIENHSTQHLDQERPTIRPL
jgi:hypothetical protein